MGRLDLRDNLYMCTRSSMWVCMVEGRFLTSRMGIVGFTSKQGAVMAFKESYYWRYIKNDLHRQYTQLMSTKEWLKIENDKYKELLDSKIVQFIEITKVPEWANI